jgi:hypothetical protein
VNPAALPSLHSRMVSILWGARGMHPSPFAMHGSIPGRERSCGALPRLCMGSKERMDVRTEVREGARKERRADRRKEGVKFRNGLVSCPGVNPASNVAWFLHCLSSSPLRLHSRSF